MKPTIFRTNSKSTIQPVIVTNDTKLTPKLSDQTIGLKNNDQIKSMSCFDLTSNICLYTAFSLNIVIGGGGVVLCAVYYSAENTQNWKIAGLVMGFITCVTSLIMIYISLFNRTNNRPWTYTHEETLINDEYLSSEDIDQLINNAHSEEDFHDVMISRTSEKVEHRRRDTASSPIPNPSYPPLVTFNNDAIFCAGCNRLHPSAHKCMYFTQRTNSFIPRIRLISQEKSTPIQTEDISKKRELTKTSLDQSIIHSVINEAESETDQAVNTTDDIILNQVSLSKAEVLLHQPRTKIMIVRVPKGVGQLVIQPQKPPTESF